MQRVRPSFLLPIRSAGLVALLGGCLGDRPASFGGPHPVLLAKIPDLGELSGESICAGAPSRDDDGDGLSDACEARLAERFAPIVIHSSDETNFPTNVDTFLRETSLTFRDDACDEASGSILVEHAPTQADLVGRSFDSPCGGPPVISDGSRSRRKRKTFFLADVSADERRGSDDSRNWTTYVHAYPNDLGGVTLQYWRFYAYNDAMNDHGGDWEGVHVALGADDAVVRVHLLEHSALQELSPRELEWNGTHVVVYSEGGGHGSRRRGYGINARGCADSEPCVVSLDDPKSYVGQETWNGGHVTWPDGRVTAGGGLLNVGEKSAPLHGQVFLRYAGLWGSPGALYMTSGYWGPAYNETSMRDDGFITAWCAGMAGPLDRQRECWASRQER